MSPNLSAFLLFVNLTVLRKSYFVFSMLDKSMELVYCMVLPFLLVLLVIRWLAWRSERKTEVVLAGKPG